MKTDIVTFTVLSFGRKSDVAFNGMFEFYIRIWVYFSSETANSIDIYYHGVSKENNKKKTGYLI